MSAAKHTPGPWSVFMDDEMLGKREAYRPGIEGVGATIVLYGIREEDGEGVRGSSIAEEDANARLIAAAPELLEALTEILNALEDRQDVLDGPDGEQRPNEAMALLGEFGPLLRAAMNKALGRAA